LGKYTPCTYTSIAGWHTIEAIIGLFHHRWSVPLVWLLFRKGALTFGMIDEALGGSRDTLSKTLSSLTSNGLVAHAPGTRGLYSLTTAGLSVGAECGAAVDAVRDAGTHAEALKKWPMMVLTVIGRGCTHYS
jgi:DNA-binding HxlR family transcriptional regulator